jgi:hypothetical protein
LPEIGCAAVVNTATTVCQEDRAIRFAAAARQIAGKPAPTACGQNRKRAANTRSILQISLMEDVMEPSSNDSPQHPEDPKPPTFWQMLHSVMAAAFGVQSHKNRARDFTHGKPSHFVILGVAFTAIFALALLGIVQLALYFALN